MRRYVTSKAVSNNDEVDRHNKSFCKVELLKPVSTYFKKEMKFRKTALFFSENETTLTTLKKAERSRHMNVMAKTAVLKLLDSISVLFLHDCKTSCNRDDDH